MLESREVSDAGGALRAARDEVEALAAVLAAKDDYIDRLERLVAFSTVVDARYSVVTAARRTTVKVWCRDCGMTVETLSRSGSYGLVRDAIRRHERDGHAGEQPVGARVSQVAGGRGV
jgi:hypothetical protein